jgi:hypothetical protein
MIKESVMKQEGKRPQGDHSQNGHDVDFSSLNDLFSELGNGNQMDGGTPCEHCLELTSRILADAGRLLMDMGEFLQQQEGHRKEQQRVERFEDAKEDLEKELKKLNGTDGPIDKADGSKMSEEDKKKAKKAVDEAIKHAQKDDNDDLNTARDTLTEERKRLAGNGKKLAPPDVLDAFGSLEIYITLIQIKKNWRPGLGLGVRDVTVKSSTDGKGQPKCTIHIEAYAPGLPKKDVSRDIDVPAGKCDDAKKLVDKLKKKVAACNYPDIDDAKALWDLLK